MKKIDKLILISVVLISLFGLLMIYSSSSVWAEYKFNDPYKFLKTQSVFLIVGYFIIFIVSKLDYRIYFKYSNIILLSCISSSFLLFFSNTLKFVLPMYSNPALNSGWKIIQRAISPTSITFTKSQ